MSSMVKRSSGVIFARANACKFSARRRRSGRGVWISPIVDSLGVRYEKAIADTHESRSESQVRCRGWILV